MTEEHKAERLAKMKAGQAAYKALTKVEQAQISVDKASNTLEKRQSEAATKLDRRDSAIANEEAKIKRYEGLIIKCNTRISKAVDTYDKFLNSFDKAMAAVNKANEKLDKAKNPPAPKVKKTAEEKQAEKEAKKALLEDGIGAQIIGGEGTLDKNKLLEQKAALEKALAKLTLAMDTTAKAA